MSIDLDSLRTLVARATGTGWEAAYRQDVAALVAEVERLRAEAAEWARLLIEAKKEGARSAVETREAERAAVVAWLRARGVEIEKWPPGGMNEISLTYDIVADEITRGEHRREGGE